MGAIVALTSDFSVTNETRNYNSLHYHLSDFAPKSLAALKLSSPDRSFSTSLLSTYLHLPAVLSLGLTGLLLGWLGRRRKQIRIFAN